jgi:Tfp pilus assembly protein PilX
MQYMLIAVTALSAVVAMVMCAIVIRMLRDERRRSDARVEALLEMANEAPAEAPLQQGDLELNPAAAVIAVPGLFAERDTASPWGRRLGAATACAAVLVAGILAVSSWEGWGDIEEVASVPTGTSSSAPLELLSLAHTAEAKALTITGVVQNPRGGAALPGVTAVAFLFAQDGGFISSGRAPLDFTRLEPGSESPFVVQVPVGTAVARYRVSFRSADGAVIAHVDRRSAAGPLAKKD